jgi:hypothetical protein
MRTLTIILAILPFLGYSQKQVNPALIEEIKLKDLIVFPDDYLLGQNPDSISYIEFQRENDFSGTEKIYAVITPKDGFNNNYSIGQIVRYMRSEYQVGYFVTVHLKSGSEVTEHRALDFSNGSIPESEDYEAADYDAEGEPFSGTWDGMEVVAD